MKKICNIIILISSLLYSQEWERYAVSSKEGIYIKMGSSITQEYKLERSLASSDKWINIPLPVKPKTYEEFYSNVQKYSSLFASVEISDKDELVNIWLQANRTGIIDSVYLYGNIPLFAISFGASFLDESAEKNVLYKYRITSGKEYITQEVKYPVQFSSPKISVHEVSYNNKKNIVIWKSERVNKPSRFIVYREDIAAQKEIQIKAPGGIYDDNKEMFYSIIDTAVDEGTSYRYYIIPVDLFENTGIKSDDAFISTTNINNNLIIGLIAKGVDSLNSISLSWNQLSNNSVKSIEIYRSEEYDSLYMQIAELAPQTIMFLDQEIEPLKTYYYKLRVIGVFDETSQFSNRVFAMYSSKIKPQSPIFVSAEGTKKGIKLKWLKPDIHIKGYYVYRNNGGGEDLLLISSLIKSNDSLVVWEDTSSELSGRKNYSYTLVCENTSHLTSNFSDTLTARPMLPIDLMAPLNLSASIEDSKVYLSWENMYRIDDMVLGYKLYKKENGSEKFTPLDTLLNINQNHFEDKINKAENNLEYAVAALSVNGEESQLSAPVTVSSVNTKPAAPGSPTLIGYEEGITISWNESLQDNIKEYCVYRYQRGKAPVKIKIINAEEELKVIDKDVKQGELYFYYITIVNVNGLESNPGEETSIRF